jgi:hypothetical protein
MKSIVTSPQNRGFVGGGSLPNELMAKVLILSLIPPKVSKFQSLSSYTFKTTPSTSNGVSILPLLPLPGTYIVTGLSYEEIDPKVAFVQADVIFSLNLNSTSRK